MQGENGQIYERRLDLSIYKGVEDVVASKDIDPRHRCLVVLGAAHLLALAIIGAAQQKEWPAYAERKRPSKRPA
jgi:hypothetical protein